jgi:hypothetical protein
MAKCQPSSAICEIILRMCGKFTAMALWAEVVRFSQPLTREAVKEGDNDRVLTYRVMADLPVIIWDGAKRGVVPMRWGWPDKNWKFPKHIHARGEAVDTLKTFAPLSSTVSAGSCSCGPSMRLQTCPARPSNIPFRPATWALSGSLSSGVNFDVPEIAATMPARPWRVCAGR